MSLSANKILTDHNLQEIFEYPKADFPFIAWQDNYEAFPNRAVASHWHNDIEFAVLTSGELDYYLSDQHLRLKQGDCVFVNTNSFHTATQCSKEKAIMIGVTFKPSVLGAINGNRLYNKFFEGIINSGIKGFQIDTENQIGNNIKKLLEKIDVLDIDSPIYELESLSLLSMLWADFYFYLNETHSKFEPIITNTRHENNVKHIISYIKMHYMEFLSIEDIAKAIGISRTECFRLFKQFTSKTPVEYILEYRLSVAANLLTSTDDTVLEICTKCGFSNSSYFVKRFREHYGITPIKYRKQNII